MNRYISHRWLAFAVLLLCSCDDNLGTSPTLSSTNVYWELRLNHHAALLSLQPPHNILQLQATPYTALGEQWLPKVGFDSAVSPTEFLSRDSSKVLVSSTGLVTARAIQSGNVYVVVTRKIGNTTHIDSALIRVADVTSPQVPDTFRIRPWDGDSAKVAVGFNLFGQPNTKSFVMTTKDAGGADIPGIPVYLTSSNPLVAKVIDAFAGAKSITTVRPGEVVLRAETWVYGVAMLDTLHFTVGYPITGNLHSRPAGVQKENFEWHYGPGASIAFINRSGNQAGEVGAGGIGRNGVPIDIVFDDSMHVFPAVPGEPSSIGGNIRGLPGDTASWWNNSVYRRFLIPGTYVYRVLPLNTTGTIIIHDK